MKTQQNTELPAATPKAASRKTKTVIITVMIVALLAVAAIVLVSFLNGRHVPDAAPQDDTVQNDTPENKNEKAEQDGQPNEPAKQDETKDDQPSGTEEKTYFDKSTGTLNGFDKTVGSLEIPGYIDGVQVKSIGAGAFSGCGDLTSVTIPDGVTSIGAGAFHGCNALTDVFYDGTEEQWQAIEIGGDNGPLFEADIHCEKAESAAFSITREELEEQIEAIRECFYNPTGQDSKVSLPRGTDGWDYSREYYYRDGRLMFAFIFRESQDEHRLYFKDDHMIRYIDENHQTYDYPDTERFETWESSALNEARSVIGYAANTGTDSEWYGTWVADTGESLEVYYVSDSGFSLVFNKLSEQGSMMSVDYEMEFDDQGKTVASEIGNQAQLSGWEYTFVLGDGFITVRSRYPDQIYYKK